MSQQLRRRPPTAARSAAPRPCRPTRAASPRASRSTRCCSSRAATARPRSWCAAGSTGTVSARSLPGAQGGAAATSSPRASPTCGAGSTSSSARARARPPRSTCAPTTSPTWGSRRPPTCPSSWSATSTAAACSRTCSARSPCSTRPTRRRIAGLRRQQVPRRPGAARDPGLDQLRALTGRPTYGVVPWSERLWLDAEDSLSAVADGVLGRPAPPHGTPWLRVAVVPAAADLQRHRRRGAGVRAGRRRAVRDRAVPAGRRRPRRPARLEGHGRRPRRGCVAPAWPTPCRAHAAAGRPGAGDLRRLPDARAADRRPARRRRPATPTGPGPARPGGRVRRREAPGQPGRHGAGASRCAATRSTTAGSVRSGDPHSSRRTAEGSDAGAVLGTHWHGLLENDGFRRALLRRVAAQAGRTGFVVAPDTASPPSATAQLDLLGDLVDGAPRHRRAGTCHRSRCAAGPARDHVRSGSLAA